jgi:hypothetical protein
MQSLCIRKTISSKKADLADSAQQFQAPRYLPPAKIAAFSGIITPPPRSWHQARGKALT